MVFYITNQLADRMDEKRTLLFVTKNTEFLKKFLALCEVPEN